MDPSFMPSKKSFERAGKNSIASRKLMSRSLFLDFLPHKFLTFCFLFTLSSGPIEQLCIVVHAWFSPNLLTFSFMNSSVYVAHKCLFHRSFMLSTLGYVSMRTVLHHD